MLGYVWHFLELKLNSNSKDIRVCILRYQGEKINDIIVNNFKVMEYIYEWKLICWCLSLNKWTFKGEEGNEGRWPLRRQEGYQHSRPRHCQAILQGKKQHVVWSKTKKITPARTEATCWNLASEMDEWPKTATPNTSLNPRHSWTDIYCSFIFDFCGILFAIVVAFLNILYGQSFTKTYNI